MPAINSFFQNQEEMNAVAELMKNAMKSSDGLAAVAAAIAAPVEAEIQHTQVTPQLLFQHTLPVGQRAIYQVKPLTKAFWIAEGGSVIETTVERNEVECPLYRAAAEVEIDVDVLNTGNMGSLQEYQRDAASRINRIVDKATLDVLSAAVPAANTVSITIGEVLTEGALAEAFAFIEDQELDVGTIVMRGSRFKDVKTWSMDYITEREWREKGVLGKYAGASIMRCAQAGANEVLLLPAGYEVGKNPLRDALQVEILPIKNNFKRSFLMWQTLGQIVTRPQLLAKVVIV